LNKIYKVTNACYDIESMTNLIVGHSGSNKNRQCITGVCCQWRCSASYYSDEHIETFVLRGKYSGEIATEQQPSNRCQAFWEVTTQSKYGNQGYNNSWF
jgi:hypothetical protein